MLRTMSCPNVCHKHELKYGREGEWQGERRRKRKSKGRRKGREGELKGRKKEQMI
jgi:hypothetical protein